MNNAIKKSSITIFLPPFFKTIILSFSLNFLLKSRFIFVRLKVDKEGVSMPQTFTLTTNTIIIQEIKDYYHTFGECSTQSCTLCIEHRGLQIIIEDNTVYFKGTNARQAYELWSNRHDNTHEPLYFETALGSDESGAGDYFGPLTIVSAYVPKNNIAILEQIGIRKSSKLTDEKILEIVPQFIKIKDQTDIVYSAIILNNTKYNELINKGLNLNQLKAILHNQALTKTIEKIGFKPDKIIVDKFVSEKHYFNYLKIQKNVVDNIYFSPAHSHYHMSIALSSIIARYMFLKEMQKLENLTGLSLSRGSNHMATSQAAKLIQQQPELLSQVAKVHFINTNKAKEQIKHDSLMRDLAQLSSK